MSRTPAEIHQIKPRAVAVNWMCSSCGVDAGCNCGASLMSKAQRAAHAINENPRKSNVMIAEEIGVSEPTVRRARDATSSHDEVDEPRTGLDGKVRRMPTRSEVTEDDSIDEIVAPPEVVEDNILHDIGGISANVRVINKVLKISAMDREAATRISTALDRVIGKMRSIQSMLGRKNEDPAIDAHHEVAV